jgi:hypothetical protein
MIYGGTLIACNLVGFITVLYVHYHPHLAVVEFNSQYIRRHTPNYIFVNGSYLAAILLANTLPLLSYTIYILVVLSLIIFLPKLDDGINYQGS